MAADVLPVFVTTNMCRMLWGTTVPVTHTCSRGQAALFDWQNNS